MIKVSAEERRAVVSVTGGVKVVTPPTVSTEAGSVTPPVIETPAPPVVEVVVPPSSEQQDASSIPFPTDLRLLYRTFKLT